MVEHGVAVGQVHARNDIDPCFDNAIGGDLPGADEFSAHQTNLPYGWFIDQARQDRIVQAVERWSAPMTRAGN